MRSLERNMKAISPVLAVLMMIAVAIAGSLVTYSWVMGYIGFTTDKSGQAIMIQSMAYNNDTSTLIVYVQNVGEGVVELNDDCLYLNDALVTITKDPADGIVLEKVTAKLYANVTVSPGQKITAKVTTTLGTFTEKSDYPASTTGGGGVPVTPAPEVERVQATDDGFGTATADNLLVVIAGHRDDDPNTYHEPTITDWERQAVAYYRTDTGDRRIVALFTKIATGGENTVIVDWNDPGNPSSVFTLYQEFTGATTYTPIPGFVVNSEGESDNGGDDWATSPMDISGLSDPGGENILTIGAAVWRDDGNDISNPGFTGLLGGSVSDLGGTCDGASAFSYGSAVTQTSVSWNGDGTEMVSGLLIQFACSDE